MATTSRRKLLKSIAAGSGAIVAGKSLPESWTKPVVGSVILPAHAQTSPCVFGISETSTIAFGLTSPGPDVPVTSGGTLTATVTPAPLDGEMVLFEVFLDGFLATSFNRPMTGGVASGPNSVFAVGVVEWRASYDCAVTSIYMNVV